MKERIISAIVLLIIFVPILILGELPFAILMSILAVCSLHELFKTRRKVNRIPMAIELYSYILVIFFTMNDYGSYNIMSLDYRLMPFLVLTNLTPLIFVNDKEKYGFNDALFLIGSTLFVGLTFNLLIMIREYNVNYLIYLFLITITTDVFAYITGKYIGRIKLSPKISPNKTVEGLIGGTFMGTLIPTLFYLSVFNNPLGPFVVIFLTCFLSLIGQIGDLVFSFIKREFGMKDFSNIIPGHGGILDRLDSIIFVSLTFLLIINIL